MSRNALSITSGRQAEAYDAMPVRDRLGFPEMHAQGVGTSLSTTAWLVVSQTEVGVERQEGRDGNSTRLTSKLRKRLDF